MNKTETCKFKKALNHFDFDDNTEIEIENAFNPRRLDAINYTRIKLKELKKQDKPIIVSGVYKRAIENNLFVERAVFSDIRPYIKGVKRENIEPLCDHINVFNLDEYYPDGITLEEGEIVYLVCRVRQYLSKYNEQRHTLILTSELGYPIRKQIEDIKSIPSDKYIRFTHLHTHKHTHKKKKKQKRRTVST